MPGQVGIQFFWLGIITAVVQGGLIKPLTKVFREETLFLTGNILMATGLFLLGNRGTTTPQLTSYLALMAVGHSLNLPTITSLISQKADPRRMGTHDRCNPGIVWPWAVPSVPQPGEGALFGLNVSIPRFSSLVWLCCSRYGQPIVVRRDNRSGPVKP